MDRETARRKTAELQDTANKAYADLQAGKISEAEFHKTMDQCERDNERVHTMFKSRARANQFLGAKDTTTAVRNVNVSPMDIQPDELWAMFQSVKRKQPYRCEITTKAFGAGDNGSPPVGTKTPGTPIAEGAQWPSGLFPPVIRPDLSQELRYEYDRICDHLPTVTIDAPSIEYLVHTGNTNPAAYVEELSPKPDIGMQLSTQTAVPVKLAALASISMEALQDFDYFSSWVPRELSRSIINVESQQLVLGTGASGAYPGMVGFTQTQDVLTRSYDSGTDKSGIDTLLQAVNDIRVGPAFGHADLIATHPSTWDFVKRTKTQTDAFVLAMTDPTSIGALDNLFGTQVVTNTFIPEGTAVVLDSALAARYFVRQGLTLDTNIWGDTEWSTNAISFRAEMRSVLAVLRPTAVCVVTGLSSDTAWSS